MLKIEVGGEWLKRARMYLKNNIPGGDRVVWGSGEILHLSARQLEELAEEAVRGYRDDLRAEKGGQYNAKDDRIANLEREVAELEKSNARQRDDVLVSDRSYAKALSDNLALCKDADELKGQVGVLCEERNDALDERDRLRAENHVLQEKLTSAEGTLYEVNINHAEAVSLLETEQWEIKQDEELTFERGRSAGILDLIKLVLGEKE